MLSPQASAAMLAAYLLRLWPALRIHPKDSLSPALELTLKERCKQRLALKKHLPNGEERFFSHPMSFEVLAGPLWGSPLIVVLETLGWLEPPCDVLEH